MNLSELHRALNHALFSSPPRHNEVFGRDIYEQTLQACEHKPVFNDRLRAIWGKTELVVEPCTVFLQCWAPFAARK